MLVNSDVIYINGRFLTQPITGIQRYAREVVTRLVESEPSRFEILVPQANLQLSEPLRSRVRHLGRFQGHFWEQFVLGPFVQKRRGLLYSPTMTNPIVCDRQMVTIQDLFVLEHPEWVDRKFHFLYSVLLPRLIKTSQPILAGSEFAKSEVIRKFGISESLIHVISCGVNSRFKRFSETQIVQIRDKYRLPNKFFLSLSSLEPRKNLPRLVAAWRNLPVEGRWPLVIAGKVGSTRVFGSFDATELSAIDSNIRLLGFVPEEDLPGLYSAASVFVFPSLLEGFGLPALEAAVCGSRVMTSQNSGMLEVMDGFATMVDPESVQSITNGLLAAMRSPVPPLEQCLGLRQRYDWDVSVQKLMALLKH